MSEVEVPVEGEVNLPRLIPIGSIVQRVSEECRVRVADIQGGRRLREVARPRQIAMVLSHELTTKSLPEIGKRIGNRDHTTVIHALRQVSKLAAADPEVEALLDRFRTHFDPDGKQRKMIRRFRECRSRSYRRAAH